VETNAAGLESQADRSQSGDRPAQNFRVWRTPPDWAALGIQLIHIMKLQLLLAVAGLLLATPSDVAGQTTFTKITSGPIVNDPGFSTSGSWADYDNDGDLDLFVANGLQATGGPSPEKNFFYRNDGAGNFTKLTNGPIVTEVDMSFVGAWGDYNNDGHLDLFVANSLQANNDLYRNNGDGTFAKITSGSIVNDGGESGSGAWADYDNDGWLDMIVGNLGERKFLYHNNGNGTFARVFQSVVVTNVGATYNVSWADYDNDGDLDLFVTGDFPGASRNSLYRNDGNGSFTGITQGSLVEEFTFHVVGVWGDYDNDGDLDLFVTNVQGPSFLFQNSGDGTFRKVTTGEIVSDSGESLGAAWGDYDNDGYLDLFVCRGRYNAQNNRLWHNNGNGTFTRITEGPVVNDGGHSFGCDWGDYDNDGFLDLFVANAEHTEKNFLYRNDGNSNSWFKLKLVGTVSNRAAIGAKVRVKTRSNGTDLWQMREITCGGNLGGKGLIAQFGLGSAATIETVRIEWPSGTVQELRDVAAKQFLTVTEPSQLSTGLSNGQFQLLLKGGVGFSYAVQSSSNLVDWSPLTNVVTTNMTMPVMTLETANFPQQFFRAVRQ